MNIQEQFNTLLTGATAAGDRIYPLIAEQDAAAPFVVFQRVSVVKEEVLDGSTRLLNTRMQVDSYAPTIAQAVSVADQVDALMVAWPLQSIQVSTQDFFDEQTKLYRVSTDYSIWHSDS